MNSTVLNLGALAIGVLLMLAAMLVWHAATQLHVRERSERLMLTGIVLMAAGTVFAAMIGQFQ